MRFLGLGLEDIVPDATTVWLFREALAKATRWAASSCAHRHRTSGGEDRHDESHLQHAPFRFARAGGGRARLS
jgi:hypothetical protein